MKIKALLFLIVFGMLAAACQEIPASPAATAQPSPLPAGSQDSNPAATLLPVNAPTQQPTATATLKPSVTPSPTATATATPIANFDRLQVISVDNNPFGSMVHLALPGIRQPLTMKLDGKLYNCRVDEKYPDHFFCQGLSRPALDTTLKLVFIDPVSQVEIYAGSLFILEAWVIPPTPVGYLHTSCAERGKNVSCETECRIAPDGSPCIVSTCTDACGPYFAVHSCPDDMPLPSPSCSEEQWVAMKKKYQIP